MLEARFGSDEAFGVEYVESGVDGGGQSLFPDGTSAVFCSNYALQVKQAMPNHDVQIVGFETSDNPDCAVSRENWGDGHDFAIVDHRYLVDAWAKLVEGLRQRIVYDMLDDQDVRIVAETYGDPLKWVSVTEENLQWDRRGTEQVMAHFNEMTRTVAPHDDVSSPVPLATKTEATDNSPSFSATDHIAQEMLKRIETSPYTLSYLLGQGPVEEGSVEALYARESAQGEYADAINVILEDRVRQNELALAEKGWGSDTPRGDLTSKSFVGTVIHLEPGLDAMGYMVGLTYQIIQNGKLEESIRDTLERSSTEIANALHTMASEALTDAAERTAAENSGDPYPDEPEIPLGLAEIAAQDNTYERILQDLQEDGGWDAVQRNVALQDRQQDALDPLIQARARLVADALMAQGWERSGAAGFQNPRFLGVRIAGSGTSSRSGGNLVKWGYQLTVNNGPGRRTATTIADDFREKAESFAQRLIQNMVEMAERMGVEPTDVQEDVRIAHVQTLRDAVEEAIISGASFGDLTQRLRGMGINVTMSSDDVNRYFFMPVPADTIVMSNAEEPHEDTTALVQIQGELGDLSIVSWNADLNAYLQAQADALNHQEEPVVMDDLEPGQALELDQALIAHLRERQSVRQGEHPDWRGLGDSVANAQEFVRQHAMRHPHIAEAWAVALRDNPVDYADALELESDNLRGIATLMEESVKRIQRPRVGDLVRFEPHDPNPLQGTVYSGRVIAAQDTSGGDVRYHLRAESGPDVGMEATVYGRNGSFSMIDLENAYGFERNASSATPAPAEDAAPAQRQIPSRGEYLRFLTDQQTELEGVVLDSRDINGTEHFRLRRIYRWPDGRPSMSGADHIAYTILPENVLERVPGAVLLGMDLDAIDPLTDAYKRSMGADHDRAMAEYAVLTAVETARGVSTRPLPVQAEPVQNTPLQEAVLSDPVMVDGTEIETRAFLEERFGSDAAFGVQYINADTGEAISNEDISSYEGDLDSFFPDGSITNCTNYARHIQQALPAGAVQVVGFANEENSDCDVVREGWHPGGHDFAIVDHRYLVDPWAKLVAGVRQRIAYDLQDDQDAALVAQTYGSPESWVEIPEETYLSRTYEWDRTGLDKVFARREARRVELLNAGGIASERLDADVPVAESPEAPEAPEVSQTALSEPSPAVSDFPIQDFAIPQASIETFESRVYVGDKKKARNNMAAIRLLQHLNQTHSIQHHGLSPEEQNTLSAYVGWGGLPKAFRDTTTGEVDPDWEDVATELESLLTDAELRAARRSTLDAHYTSATIISAMWSGLEATGFQGGAIMEPSMGTGLFFALQPEALKSQSRRFGVEMDPTSANIALWLYPESRIDAQPFQNVNHLEGMMDVVIGNPPFGDQSVFDPAHPEWSEDAPNIHSYFFRKGLEQLQPGGVQAFVVSRYFLDARSTEYEDFRKRFHRDAELLTAVRLPRNAFMANAGTQVVTDILFFRKRMEPLEINHHTQYPDWVSGDGIIGQDPETGRGVPGNRYYEAHPDHLLGIPVLVRGMYQGDEPVVLPNRDQDLGERIRAVIVPELKNQNIVWPESRLLAEERWKQANRLYTVTDEMKEAVPAGSFFMIHADPVVAREENGFVFSETEEDFEEVLKRLDAVYPPRLAVRVSTYRGFQFASEMMVPVPAKKVTKEEEGQDGSSEESEEQATPSTAMDSSEVALKRAFSDTEIQRITGLVGIRDALQKLIRAQGNPHLQDADVEARRDDLNTAYDTFAKKYGLLNRPINQRVFRQDTFSGALLALEKNYSPEISAAVARKTGEEPRPESAEKSILFTQRTQWPYTMQDRADTPLDALRLSLSQFGKIDPVFMENALQETVEGPKTWADIRDELGDHLYLDLNAAMGTEFWTRPMIEWTYEESATALSGDILDKLARVEGLLSRMESTDTLVGVDEITRLQQGLEASRPKQVPMRDIGVRFGASWVSTDIYAQFVREIMGAVGLPDFSYSKALAKWEVSAAFPQEQELRWGVQGAKSPVWILNKTLNRQPLLVTYKSRDGQTIVLEKETEIAKQKSQEIQKEWTRWVQTNEAVADRLEKDYNLTFNRFSPPRYDGRHLDLLGSSSAITLRPHQKNAIWRGMQSGKTFFDHAVGAGKTYAAVGLAMEMRRLKRAQKPMIVVPNHLVDQWRSAFMDLYPAASVLTASPADGDAKNRQVFLGKVAYGDWDAVIVPHSLFSRIAPDAYWSGKVMEEELLGFEDAIRELNQSNKTDKRTIKQLERKVERIKSRIAEANSNTGKKDAGLTMGDIGVDFLFVDEVQEFKNLPYVTELKNVAGLGNPEGSSKAQDLYVKARSIQKMRDDHGGIVYLSGTPLSNTMAELYTWMRHFAFEDLDRMGILHFDAWQNAFADITRDYAFTLTGDYKEKAYLSVFDNLPELRALTQQFMDTVSIADVRQMLADEGLPDMPIPPIAGGKPEVVVCQPTQDQKWYIGEEVGEKEDGSPKFNEGSIMHRLDNMPRRPGKGEDNILSLSGEMSKVGLDLRAVDGRDNGRDDVDNGEKLLRCVNEIVNLYQRWENDRGTQLVFLDFSTPVTGRKGAVRKPSAADLSILNDLDTVRKYERDLEDYGEADEALQRKAEQAQERLDALPPQEIEDVENKLRGDGEDRWSAYEALRKMLVERGIPEEEIAFIHEYEKPQDKAELFGMMRSGKMRVLMGSSSKMGAGMNVQDRLVALHHLDAPYRPLDIEQRNGRGLRQGNKLLEKYGPEQFQMAVNYYVTEGAGDAGRWQILEFKKKFIDQYAQRNDGLRRVEDPSAQALDPARIKAESSGSDVLMDKTVLSDLSKKLRTMESAWNNTLRELRGAMSRSESSIKSLSQRLPFVKEAALVSQSWLQEVGQRQESLEAERTAERAARAAERAARKAERAAQGELQDEDTSPADAQEAADAPLELTPSDKVDQDAQDAVIGHDVRGPLHYQAVAQIVDGVPEFMEKQDQRITDMGMDVLRVSGGLLRTAINQARRDRYRGAIKDAVVSIVGVPLLKVGTEDQQLQLVLSDVEWKMSQTHDVPEGDDTFLARADWLDRDGKWVSSFAFSEGVRFLYALEGKDGPEVLRKSGTGLGQRVLNAIKAIQDVPNTLQKQIRAGQTSLAAYKKEYDRLTQKAGGVCDEAFPQQHRLALVDAMNYCMDMALKGGLRKSAVLDEKLQTLQENLLASHARLAKVDDSSDVEKASDLAVSDDEAVDTQNKPGATQPVSSKIEMRLEALMAVAPEIRYWSAHREGLVDNVKNEAVEDVLFADILSELQNRENQEGLPYDESQMDEPARNASNNTNRNQENNR
ncbi:Eco57I restriction-modification methylase domain-containing protein [Acidithiobacillus sulfurivorans]|uniref:N-6 DNA methylase n=1 Tax=Acidithiobacillus sulfurivorans TaxID=1958756 RepID=A0ABS6A2K4_9PROT|nr:N-6 DNA methylase [Acidithiobacillus sulfurivorans]MBU2761164.1 N-6 DNA methylase [Acidithiobacillus sulfurivorans]